ncbi:hypothetical protein SEVIR_9G253500v4 [Setaria viridis]|uniref:Uncharacterized protein n=1 Tax=Setaria viridis TaxID=4556 RepID=A0A4U6T039_SETVI|nr:hypothetical protein SEVIR_9G253500v2 [Setaria viridis]
MLLMALTGEFQVYYNLMTTGWISIPILGFFVILLAIFDSLAREPTSGPLAMDLKREVPAPVLPDEGTADGRLSLPVHSEVQRCVDAFDGLSIVVFQKVDVSLSVWDSTCGFVLCALLLVKPWCSGLRSVFVQWP